MPVIWEKTTQTPARWRQNTWSEDALGRQFNKYTDKIKAMKLSTDEEAAAYALLMEQLEKALAQKRMMPQLGRLITTRARAAEAVRLSDLAKLIIQAQRVIRDEGIFKDPRDFKDSELLERIIREIAPNWLQGRTPKYRAERIQEQFEDYAREGLVQEPGQTWVKKRDVSVDQQQEMGRDVSEDATGDEPVREVVAEERLGTGFTDPLEKEEEEPRVSVEGLPQKFLTREQYIAKVYSTMRERYRHYTYGCAAQNQAPLDYPNALPYLIYLSHNVGGKSLAHIGRKLRAGSVVTGGRPLKITNKQVKEYLNEALVDVKKIIDAQGYKLKTNNPFKRR